MKNTNPIGLFDSGIGGTSIWKEVQALLPHENTIYLADSKNAPYGLKSKEEIISLSCKNTEFLLEQNCKLIVVACNTATTNAIKELRSKYDIPFIGIEPAIKPAAIQSKTHTIGILATKGTLNSELFHKNVSNHPDVKIIEQIGHGLVQLIENGDINTPEIKKIIPSSIKIIDSGEAVAKQTKKILEEHNLMNDSKELSSQLFYTNSNPKVLENILNNKEKVFFKAF